MARRRLFDMDDGHALLSELQLSAEASSAAKGSVWARVDPAGPTLELAAADGEPAPLCCCRRDFLDPACKQS